MDFGIFIPLTEDQADEVGDDISCRCLSSARESTTDIRRVSTPHGVTRLMENDSEVPLHRLRCLRGLGRAGFTPMGAKFQDVSVRTVANVSVRNVPKPRYRWTVDTYVNQGIGHNPGRKQVPVFLRRSKTLQIVQNKPFQRYYTQLSFAPGRQTSHVSEPSHLKVNTSDRRYSLAFVYKPDTTVRKLLKPNTELPLLRRPTSTKTRPVQETDSQFEHFTKSLVELKPKNFATSTEQDIFYNKNYPLLLDAHPEDDVSTLPRKRTPTPEIAYTPEMKRGVSITSRIQHLKDEINTLEEETDGIDFRTVLRDDAFDPANWPWNQGRPSYVVPSPSSSRMHAVQRPKSPSPGSVSTLPKAKRPPFSPGQTALSPY